MTDTKKPSLTHNSSSTSPTGLDVNRKLFLAIMGIGLLAMLAGSFMYRLSSPGLVTDGRPRTAVANKAPSEAEIVGPMMQQLQKNPNNIEALMFLGEHFLGHENWAQAATFLQKAVVAAPSEPRPLYLLGICQYHNKEYAEAAASFERLLTLYDEPAARYNLGLLYRHNLNNIEKAKTHIEALLANAEAPEELKKLAQEELNALTQSKTPQ